MAHVVHPPSSGALEVCNCSADDRSEIVVHVFAANRSRHGALVAGVFFKNFGELQGPPAVLPGELGVPPIPNRERRSINKNALLGDRCLTGHLLHLLYSRSRWSDLNMVTSIYMDPEVTVSGSCQPLSQDCKRG